MWKWYKCDKYNKHDKCVECDKHDHCDKQVKCDGSNMCYKVTGMKNMTSVINMTSVTNVTNMTCVTKVMSAIKVTNRHSPTLTWGGMGGQLKNRTKPQTWLNCTELSRPLTKLSWACLTYCKTFLNIENKVLVPLS